MADHDELIERMRALGNEPVEPALQASHLTAMSAVRANRRTSLWPKLHVAAALVAGLLIGSTGLATAGALPDPAQRIAHSVLGQVGIDVPKPDRYHGQECGTEVKRNHGAYVSDDKTLAKSDCGKPVQGAKDGDLDEGAKDPKPPRGPCEGKPPWAADKSMTEEEKALAQAERTALCGQDEDEAEKLETAEPEERTGAEPETTTTTAEPQTTTTTTV